MKNASNMSTCIDSYTTQSEGSGKLILYLDYFTTEKKLMLSFLIVTTISAISLVQPQTSNFKKHINYHLVVYSVI